MWNSGKCYKGVTSKSNLSCNRWRIKQKVDMRGQPFVWGTIGKCKTPGVELNEHIKQILMSSGLG